MTDGAAFRPSPALTEAEHAIVERAMAARRTAPAVGLAVDGRERIAKFSF
jgi:hypothetical protein